ncbi:MAG: Hpt domain protein [Cyanobacteria bacterium RYN_339]|nr:Hpt domain protein [Cyanobacteria bacterium RYN_339]
MEPLASTFADDPDMAELVPIFVGMLPDRMAAMRASLAAGDLDALRVTAHQLKGAAGGYGFAPIGHAAATLEAALIAGQPPDPALAALEAVAARAKA